MTAELKELIDGTYPPTPILLHSIGASIGTVGDIVNALMLHEIHGRRTWRRWVCGERLIPKLYYEHLVKLHW
jgi:hypothetical protein